MAKLNRVTVLAPAKLNLALDVVGTLPNGYHDLDMTMQAITLYEKVVLTRSNGLNLTLPGSPVAANDSNTAIKAAIAFFRYTGLLAGVDITVYKNIPVRAGMAGGSADAAAVLVGLNALYGARLSMSELCALGAKVGADVPFALMGGTCRVQGVGDVMKALPPCPDCWFTVVMPELRDALRKRNLRMVNRRADIYLEMEDGTSEDYLTGDECPFDLSQDLIDVPDDDFGVWYVDVMDHPDRWAGKMVHMKLIMCHSKKYPGIHCPGRFVMTCCENDIQFMGLIAKGTNLNQYQNRDWVEVTGRMAVEKHAAYKGKGPVMHVISIGPCEKPQQEVVTF